MSQGLTLSLHHSDQMSGRQLFFFCMSISKVLSGMVESVTRSPIELFWTAKNDKQVLVVMLVAIVTFQCMARKD